MVSEFRKKKLLHLYYAFFDTSRSGTITKRDFELAMEKIAKHRGYKPGDLTYQLINELLQVIWTGFEQDADLDGNGEISIDEWVSLWDKYAQNPDAASEWQKLFCRCIFQLEDVTDDGAIDCEEFSAVYESFGLDKQQSIEAFKKMAQGKEKIDLEEFEVLWKEYFVTENPDDPGNFIFGSQISV